MEAPLFQSLQQLGAHYATAVASLFRIEQSYPDCIFDLAMGDNVRHLSVGPCCYYYEEPFSVHQVSHPPSGLICIESLFRVTNSSRLLDSLLRSTPTRRVSTRRLRKLVLKTDEPVTQAFLEICDALEGLKVIVNSSSISTLELKEFTFSVHVFFPQLLSFAWAS